jgi:hypothetical protein
MPLLASPAAVETRMARLSASLLAVLLMTAAVGGCPSGTQGDDDGPFVNECSDEVGATRPPEVEIVDPGETHEAAADEAINWVVQVADEDTELGELLLVARDYRSGVPEDVDVEVPSPDGNGRSSFAMPAGTLDEGRHPIRIRATDPDDCYGEDDVLVCVETESCP